MTPQQLEILQHALGLDQYGQGVSTRNHFCAGGDDVAVCAELVAIGYMRTFQRSWLPYYNCYVTQAGREAVQRESPKPPKLTRSQIRWRQWMNVAYVFNGDFKAWLRYEKEKAGIAW